MTLVAVEDGAGQNGARMTLFALLAEENATTAEPAVCHLTLILNPLYGSGVVPAVTTLKVMFVPLGTEAGAPEKLICAGAAYAVVMMKTASAAAAPAAISAPAPPRRDLRRIVRMSPATPLVHTTHG
jgi:hypothetical protein